LTYFADNVVETLIGDGTLDAYITPFNNYYKVSWDQSIYTISEIGHAGTIGSVSWYSTSTATVHYSDLRIYMGVTSLSEASTTTSWVPMEDLTLVYSSTDYTAGGNVGWESFTLNTPFVYDGSGNLAIVVAKNTLPDSFNSSVKYRYTTVANRVLYRQDDNDASYASHPGTSTGTTSNYLPNIKIVLGNVHDVCLPVTALAVSNVTTTSAVVSWIAGTSETAWILKYGEAGFDVATGGTTLNPTDTTATINGLSATTTYDVYVKAICAVDDESGWARISFTTPCETITTMPWSENFESLTANNIPNCWDNSASTSSTVNGSSYYIWACIITIIIRCFACTTFWCKAVQLSLIRSQSYCLQMEITCLRSTTPTSLIVTH
jgi:hypothetical protein